MSQGTHAQLRNLAQKRAQLKNYNAAQQQLKVNDRNQALAVLNSQFSQGNQNAGVIQRQLYLQEQQNINNRNNALHLLNNQTVQNQNTNGMINQQGYNPNMIQQQGYNNSMMQNPNMMGQQGYNVNMMNQPGFNPGMMHQQGYNNPMMQNPNMMHQQGFNAGIMNQQGIMQNSMLQNQGMYNNGTSQCQQNSTIPSTTSNSTYIPPVWSSMPLFKYQLRLIENGNMSFVDLIGKPFLSIGRQETCDIQLETPSVSRQHAIIQHRGGGSKQGSDELFIFDLASTSGTFLNTQQLNPKSYYALQPGDIINFGSSPDFVLCGGPNNYQPPLPVIQTPLPKNESETTKASIVDDEIDAIIHAKCSDHLLSSLATLERLFTSGQILDDEYYKKKSLIQDQMHKQQEEMRLKIRQKKAEAREKQNLEEKASKQKVEQKVLYERSVSQKLPNMIHKPVETSPTPQVTTTPSQPKIVDNSLDDIFTSSLSKNVNKNKNTAFATLKMDPRSADFDAVAYKRMMVEQYEQQMRNNEIQLKLRKLGDPTNAEFNPSAYKRLMIEKYEHEKQMEETKRLITEANKTRQ